MTQAALPEWESAYIDEVIAEAERRLEDEKERAAKRAVQLAREQAYHRLAVEIGRPADRRTKNPGQLSLFRLDDTLFDDAS